MILISQILTSVNVMVLQKYKKNLILCAAIDLDIIQIRNFFVSFRKYNKDAEIYCIVEENLNEDKKNFLIQNNVCFLYMNFAKFLMTKCNNTRYLKFYDFIFENSKKYNNVILSDVRDVVFQKDPFKNLHGDFIITPEEEDQKNIEMDQVFNSRWIKQVYGEEVYQELKHKGILCCGTVVGSIQNIEIYLRHMCEEMFRVYCHRKEVFYDMLDTAIHTYLFYKNSDIFQNPIIKKNGDYIATIGTTVLEHQEKINVDDNHILFEDDLLLVNNLIPSIIHQYDRSLDLIDFFDANYNNSNIKICCYQNLLLYVLSNDRLGQQAIANKVWEQHIRNFLAKHLTKESVFVDIGSFYGFHSIFSASICGQVYSFEPQTLIYRLQKKSIKINKLNNIELFNLALGQRSGIQNISWIDYYEENTNLGDLCLSEHGRTIKITKLDDFQFERIDLIKIDVQGYEKFVLEGAINKIQQFKPILIVEFEEFQLNKFNYTCKDLFDYIRSLDYEIYFLDYVYPSDHICVPRHAIDEFESKYQIVPLTTSNSINYNLANGISKKIIFN